MKEKKHGQQEGFTLIEMIFVLAIVLTLVAIFTPLAMDKLSQSKTAKAQADIDALAAALTNFFANVGNFPSCDGADCDPLNDAGNNLRFLAVATGSGNPTSELPSETLWTLAGDMSGTAARNNAFNHLAVNDPNANTTTDEANVDYRAWRGPHISKLGPDPWGRAYIVHVGAMQRNGCPVGSTGAPPACTAPAAGARGWILSAGPDGNLDTGPTATQLAGDDVGYIFCTNC
jgi:prepilin-type N-terminal cleavage/methylation domain-containing protein